MIAANFVPPYGAWVTIKPVSFFGIRQTLIPVNINTHISLQAGIVCFITVYIKKYIKMAALFSARLGCNI